MDLESFEFTSAVLPLQIQSLAMYVQMGSKAASVPALQELHKSRESFLFQQIPHKHKLVYEWIKGCNIMSLRIFRLKTFCLGIVNNYSE